MEETRERMKVFSECSKDLNDSNEENKSQEDYVVPGIFSSFFAEGYPGLKIGISNHSFKYSSQCKIPNYHIPVTAFFYRDLPRLA